MWLAFLRVVGIASAGKGLHRVVAVIAVVAVPAVAMRLWGCWLAGITAAL